MDEIERLTKFFSKFFLHLYTTHGVPLEFIKDKLKEYPGIVFYLWMQDHPDFKEQF